MRPSRARIVLLIGALVVAACDAEATGTAPPAPVVTPTPAPTAGPTPNAASAPIALSVVSCTSYPQQLCEPAAVVTVWTEAALTVDFTASPSHCSPMIAHVSVDNGAKTAVSTTLDAGVSSGPLDLGPVAPGRHVVAIQGEGVVGGCNHGGLGSWVG